MDVTQGAIFKFEHADDVSVSTLREYLEALGARLELVPVFDDDDEHRVPIQLGKEPAAYRTVRSPAQSLQAWIVIGERDAA